MNRQTVLATSGSSICLASVLWLLFATVGATAQQNSAPVSIKASCDGKISSVAFSFFTKEIGASQKYRLVRTLADDGRMDKVLTIDMNCTEHGSIMAVATVYGRAKCFSLTTCHMAVDGSSIRSNLCDSNAPAECGRLLFKAFDDYVNNPLAPRLRLY